MRSFSYILLWFLLPLPLQALELSVEVSGLEKELEANVRAFLSIEREKVRESLTASRLRLVHNRAPGEIEKALQPFGYFKPVIETELTEGDEGYVASYRVDPGPPVLVDEVSVELSGEGKADPLLRTEFPLARGDVLDHREYEKGKKRLLAVAVENGYLKARYETHEVRVDLDRYAASIRLRLETGRHYRFGEVRFYDNVVDSELLARYADFEPGDPFDHRKLLKLQSQLIDSEYFKSVEVRTLRDEAVGDRVPVELHFTPNNRDRYRAGLGYSTDMGPRLTLDFKRRRVNRRGHRFASELRLSPVQTTLQSEYIIPLERPASDSISFGASLDHEETDTRKEFITLVEASHSAGLGNGWQRTLKLSYSYEDYDVADDDDDAFLLVPSVRWSHLESDGLEYIRRGRARIYRIEGAVEELLSDTSYLTLLARERFIYGFGGGDWRLLTRVELGVTLTDDVTDLPSSKRFFAGGDVSIRGFELDELGPENAAGEVVGGRYLAVAGVELERRLFGKWSGALFLDAGNAFDPDYDSDVEYGAGLGVRWGSPVGPIRFDVAYGLSADDPSWRLHIIVGPQL